jgi:hypothetical protein
MAIGDVYQVTYTWDYDGQRVQSVLHFKERVAETAAPASFALIEALNAAFTGALSDCIVSGVNVVSMYARRVKPTPDIPYLLLADGNPPFVGEVAGDPCPPQAAMLFSFYCTPAGASARGRLYLPGCSEAAQASGQITPAQLAIMEATRDTMLDDIGPVGANTGIWDLAVYSRKLGTADIVDVCIAHTNLATIRSRRAYAGVS